MGTVYRNRLIINQRGGSISIDNTTEQEKIKISHRSGSNISMTNVVNSELATTNKQVNVVNDHFETAGGNKSQFNAKDYIHRVGQNSYVFKGFVDQLQIDSFTNWKNAYAPIANINSQFKIQRGGYGFPNGTIVEAVGSRSPNPVINSKVFTLNNSLTTIYTGIPIRKNDIDEITTYAKVPERRNPVAAKTRYISNVDINQAAGKDGSNAPGVIEYGPDFNPATELGTWQSNRTAETLDQVIFDAQETLNAIEKEMGDGGDEIHITKKNKFEQVGATFNDYPSVRIDEKGRSQPLEIVVSETGAFKNHDYVPHIEEVDNSSNFPCGNDDSVVGNRFSKTVGSGGVHLKTTGTMELGGTSLKVGFKRANINASHGIQIASESFVEIQSLKTITLRTNRQVYVECSLGVKNNLIVGGGAYVEGELYCQHITAPLEVHQTEDTTVYGKFATDTARTLQIGEVEIGGRWFPVFAMPTDNLLIDYPHSHHHNGIPMRLTAGNKDVRNLAASERINVHTTIAQSLAQKHERKRAIKTTRSTN